MSAKPTDADNRRVMESLKDAFPDAQHTYPCLMGRNRCPGCDAAAEATAKRLEAVEARNRLLEPLLAAMKLTAKPDVDPREAATAVVIALRPFAAEMPYANLRALDGGG